MGEMCPIRKGKSTTWITPQWLIDIIGKSDLDPCGFLGPNGEPFVETAEAYFTLQEGDDGLKLDWFGSIFCNPPYDKNKQWLRRCYEHHKLTGEDVIVLIFSRTSTGYFQEYASRATALKFIGKRLKFLNDQGNEQGFAPCGSILLAYGDNAVRRIAEVPGFLVFTEVPREF
jgi:hypothetical protein